MPSFSRCSAHKDLFIPANMTSRKGIVISTTIYFPRTVEAVKQGYSVGGGDVITLFADDTKSRPQHLKEVVFMTVDGKIDADAIFFGGYGGKISGAEFFGQK